MYCIGLVMKLKSDCYDRYKQAHDKLWPGVAQSMSNHRVSMAIYRFGDHLFVHAVAPTEGDWQMSRDGSILSQWNQEMARYLETDDQGQIIFEKLPEAFAFGLFKSEKPNEVI